MGLPSEAASASNIYLKDRNEVVFNDAKKCSIFKSFFSNLAQNLVSINYLLYQMSLLSLKSHPTMMIISIRTEILNFLKHHLKKY